MTEPANTSAGATASTDELWAVAAAVPDPEMPPLNLEDLGILRSVEVVDGEVVVTVTPTYSGCPAVEAIEQGVVEALEAAGHRRVRVVRSLAPAWSTDWITDTGRAKLADVGISPPRSLADRANGADGADGVAVTIGSPTCPQCGSSDTEQVSRFGSTACKSLYRCRSCEEPFDHVKEL